MEIEEGEGKDKGESNVLKKENRFFYWQRTAGHNPV